MSKDSPSSSASQLSSMHSFLYQLNTKTCERYAMILLKAQHLHWRVVCMKTKRRKIDFVGNCTDESTSYFLLLSSILFLQII